VSYCITQILFVLTLHTFSITTFQTINLTGSNRSRTLLFVLLLRFLNPHISLPFSNLSTGLMSTNALNINFFLLPTKFLQPVNLAILTIWSLFSVQPPRSTRSSSVVTLSKFSPTNHLLIENHRSLIHICITPSLESTPWFIPSASPVMSRFTSSLICQLISIITTTLVIHHSFTLSLQAQNLPFQQILPTLDFFHLPDCLHDNGTGPDLSCSSLNF